jgi:hypothetical protein
LVLKKYSFINLENEKIPALNRSSREFEILSFYTDFRNLYLPIVKSSAERKFGSGINISHPGSQFFLSSIQQKSREKIKPNLKVAIYFTKLNSLKVLIRYVKRFETIDEELGIL